MSAQIAKVKHKGQKVLRKSGRCAPLEMCVPMERWMPEQRMQRKQPRFQLAQRGSFFLQSTHTLLSADLTRARRILAFASVCWRDWVTRDIVTVEDMRSGEGDESRVRKEGKEWVRDDEMNASSWRGIKRHSLALTRTQKNNTQQLTDSPSGTPAARIRPHYRTRDWRSHIVTGAQKSPPLLLDPTSLTDLLRS